MPDDSALIPAAASSVATVALAGLLGQPKTLPPALFYDEAGFVEQGLITLLLIVAGSALALLLFWALRRAERQRPAPIARALALSRDPRVLRNRLSDDAQRRRRSELLRLQRAG